MIPEVIPIVESEFSGPIDFDVVCKRCGYNLRGLHSDLNCPECGTPTRLSLQGDLLRYSDPGWLQRIALGLQIVLWTAMCGWAILLMTHLPARFNGVDPFVGDLATLGVSASMLIGTWLLTAPDASRRGEDPRLTARKFIRFAMIFAIIHNTLTVLSTKLESAGVPWLVITVVSSVSMLVVTTAEYAKFQYFRDLALRIPNRELTMTFVRLQWPYVGSLGAIQLGALVTQLLVKSGRATLPRPSLAVTSAAGCVFSLLGIAFFICFIQWLIAVWRLRAAVAEQAPIARATWAAEAGNSPPSEAAGR